MMEMMLKSMNDSISEQLDSIDVSKKWHSVLFTSAAMIFAAVAAAVAPARAVVGATGAVASILFAAVGRWRQSVLTKREAAVKKRKEITEHMSAGDRLGMEYLVNARRSLIFDRHKF